MVAAGARGRETKRGAETPATRAKHTIVGVLPRELGRGPVIVAAEANLRWIRTHEERPRRHATANADPARNVANGRGTRRERTAKVKRRAAGVVALLAGITLLVLALTGPRSDARDVEDVLDALVSALRVDDDADYPDARRERVDRLLEAVATDVSVEAPELLPAFSGRDALRDEIVRHGGFFRQLDARYADLRVERTGAGVEATAAVQLRGDRPMSGSVALERDVSLSLTRRGDHWVVTRIVVSGR